MVDLVLFCVVVVVFLVCYSLSWWLWWVKLFLLRLCVLSRLVGFVIIVVILVWMVYLSDGRLLFEIVLEILILVSDLYFGVMV